MNILVACEESQRVCAEFRKRGHNAFSCDILKCSGGHLDWHIQADVLPLLNGYCSFITCDGKTHTIDAPWDMIIAFPPCTHLASSGAAWFTQKRKDGRQKDAIEFFCQFMNTNCKKVVIENPVGIISGNYVMEYFPKLSVKYNLSLYPSQIIQPWQFGDNYSKTTCLWLKGLKPLKPEVTKEPKLQWTEYIDKKTGRKKRQPKWFADAFNLPPEERAKIRSKTFPGIARAMAEQWG